MINKIKHKINTTEKRQVISNFFSLSILQAVNYILPLITLPYLIRTVGMEKFGLLAFASALISYFRIVTEYGFHLYGTREVSIYRNDQDNLNKIFTSIMSIRIILTIVSFFILTLMVSIIDKLHDDALIYYFMFGVVIGQALFPVWYFQGIENMKYITYLNIVSKLVFTISIFIFVTAEEDYYLVPLLTSFGDILSGVIALAMLKLHFNVKIVRISSSDILYYIKNGWHVFISQLGMNLYRNSNVIILAMFANNAVVGNYAVAEKLLFAIQSLQAPVGQALFPFLSKKYISMTQKESMAFILANSKYFLLCYSVLAIITYIFAEQIILLVTGNVNSNVIINFQIMSFVIIIGGLNYYFGIIGLLALGLNSQFSNSVILTGIFNILCISILSLLMQDIGASLGMITSECVLLIMIYRIIITKLRTI